MYLGSLFIRWSYYADSYYADSYYADSYYADSYYADSYYADSYDFAEIFAVYYSRVGAP